MTAAAPLPAEAESQPPFQEIPLALIRESATNPRKTFEPGALKDLADSIRAKGVLSPVLVRPIDDANDDRDYELVFGARRLRAAQAAGLDKIPALVRVLGDLETLELQVVENLQRSDLSPLEEALGYEQLHKKHGIHVDDLATKVGKSRAYIYARLKLCDLPKAARELLEAGELDASRALLVARIPNAKLAEEAAKKIARGRWEGDGPMTFKEASAFVQQEFMLRLEDAPFDVGDAQLVPKAGACAGCPKRTGNQPPGLFADVDSADVCTDSKCFNAKADAAWRIKKRELEEKGVKVLEGKKGEEAKRYNSGLTSLDNHCYEDPKNRTYRVLLKDAEIERVVVRDNEGNTHELVQQAVLKAALRKAGHDFKRERTSSQRSPEEREDSAKRKERADLRDRVAIEARPRLLAAASKQERTVLLIASRALLGSRIGPLPKDLVGEGKQDTASVMLRLDKLKTPQIRSVVAALVLVDIEADVTNGDDYGDEYEALCKLLRVDLKKLEADVAKASKGHAERKAANAATVKAARAARKGSVVKGKPAKRTSKKKS